MDLLCAHILKYYLQDIHYRWDAGQVSFWSNTLWPGLWSQHKIWAGRERGDLDVSGAITVSESNAAHLTRMNNRLMLICE